LLGWDHDPATRNVFGLIKSHPELAAAAFGSGNLVKK
jgi:hypothetical protein